MSCAAQVFSPIARYVVGSAAGDPRPTAPETTRPSEPAPPRREPATPEADRQQLTIEYDISHVDGEAGVRLAARQAAAVHRLVAWLDDHQHPAGGT